MWRTLLTGYQYVLLVYFSSLNILYALFSCIGLRAIVVVFAREFSQGSLRDLLERDVYKPVSILVPAHNEEVSIVGSVQSLLNLQFPEFEIVVVSDGSEDETMQRLIEAFALAEQPWATRQDLPSAHVRRTFRSLTHPNLIVVDKDQGGKADSLNAGLNMARYPLFAAVDADSLLDGEAILRATRLFVEDETLIGVGGTIRPLNAAVVEDGRVTRGQDPEEVAGAVPDPRVRAGVLHRAGRVEPLQEPAHHLRRLRAVPPHGGPGGRRVQGRDRGRGHGAGGPPPQALPEGAQALQHPLHPRPDLLERGALGPGHPAPPAQPLAPGAVGDALDPQGHAVQPALRPPGHGRGAVLLDLRGARPGDRDQRLHPGGDRDLRRVREPAVRDPVRGPGHPLRDAGLPAGRRHRDLPLEPLPAAARPGPAVPGRLPRVRRLPAVPGHRADHRHRAGAVQAGAVGQDAPQGHPFQHPDGRTRRTRSTASGPRPASDRGRAGGPQLPGPACR